MRLSRHSGVKIATIVLALMLAACASEPSMSSGIDGIVLYGPVCPVETVSSPCPDRPYQADVRIVERTSGRTVATVRSGDDGRFRIALEPGEYTLQAVADTPIGGGKPVDVTVVAGEYVQVTVPVDSGIR
jgi:hypothetical protein